MRLCICADATPQMGTGHVMRCMALAQWARRAGIEVCLAGKIEVPWVRDRLELENIAFLPVQEEVPWEHNSLNLLNFLRSIDGLSWVVFDGYHFGINCQRAVRESGYRLLVVDDYAHLSRYSCDLLLNQNIGSNSLPYSGDIGATLLGPEYALLRPEFATARANAELRKFYETPSNLLLNFGGGDASKYITNILKILPIQELEGLFLRIIKGNMPNDIIKKNLSNFFTHVEVLNHITDMPKILLNTDICITAAGSTCWELCCMGVPSIVFGMVKNQQHVTKSLIDSEIVLPLSRANVLLCINSVQTRVNLSVQGLKTIDGMGAQRVLSNLV